MASGKHAKATLARARRAQARRAHAQLAEIKRKQKLGQLAFAAGVGLALAMASGQGIAAAAEGDGQSSNAGTDTGTGSGDAKDAGSGTTTAASGPTTSTSTQTTTASGDDTIAGGGESPGSQTTTTTTGDGPATSTSSSGGALTSSQYQENSTAGLTPPPAGSSTTETPTAIPAGAGETGSVTETSTPTTTQNQPGVVGELSTMSSETPVETTAEESSAGDQSITTMALRMSNSFVDPTTDPPGPAMQMAAATTSTTVVSPYPEVPGLTPVQVAVAVVVVLWSALTDQFSAPMVSPVVIPLFFMFTYAWQTMIDLATNHLPVVSDVTTSQLVGDLSLKDLGGSVLDPDNRIVDPDGDPLNYTVTGTPVNGGLVTVVPGTGVYTYVPSLAALRAGSDTFTVTIDDNAGYLEHFYAPDGHSVTRQVTINLGPGVPNQAPVVNLLQPLQNTDSIGVVRGRVAVTDPEGDTLTYSLANGNTAGSTANSTYTNKWGGIVTLDTSTGSYTYVPAVSGSTILGPTHIDEFTVTADDGHGGSVQTTVSVGADLKIAATGVSTDTATGWVTGSLNIPPEDVALLKYSQGLTAPSKGTLDIDDYGNFTYKPTPEAQHAAAATNATAAQKTDSFSVFGTDANGRTITVATVNVAVNQANKVPAVTTPPGYSITNVNSSDGTVTGTIVGVSDGDIGDQFTYSVTPITAGMGTLSIDPVTGVFTYQPSTTARHDAAAVGAGSSATQLNFTVSVSDGHGGVVGVPVSAPILSKNSNPTVNFGSLPLLNIVTYTPQASATQRDPDGDTLTYTITTPPTKGSVALNLDVLNANLVTAIVYTSFTVPILGIVNPPPDSFQVTIRDGHGGVQIVTLTPFA